MAAQTVEPWLEGRVRVAAVVTPESDSAPQHEWRHEQRSPQRELQSIHVGTDQIRIADRSSSAAAVRSSTLAIVPAASLPPSPYLTRNCDERTRFFRTTRVTLTAVNENVIGGHPES